jgi:hypothetical protein
VEPWQEQGWEKYIAQVYEGMQRTAVDHVAVLKQIDEDFPDEAQVRRCGDT